jgi:hypothetical protein
MSKKYSGEKPDNNQPGIVAKLRKIPGMKVRTGYNDDLIGYEKCIFWLELKNPDVCRKDGSIPDYAFTKKEIEINRDFKGKGRIIAATYNQVLDGMAQHFSDIGFLRIAENLRSFKDEKNCNDQNKNKR